MDNIFSDVFPIHKIYEWSQQKIFHKDFLIQILIIFALAIVSILLSNIIKRVFRKNFQTFSSQIKIFLHKLKSFNSLIIFIFLNIITKTILIKASQETLIFHFAIIFTTAVLLIKLFYVFVSKNIWTRSIAFVIWFIAIFKLLNIDTKIYGILDSMTFQVGKINISVFSLLKSGIFIAITLWFISRGSKIIENFINKSSHFSPSQKLLLRKISKFSLFLFGGLFIVNTVGIDLTVFAFITGAIGVGIGFGLQKIIANFISGFILLMDGSIKPGDIIELDNQFGTITNLGIRYTTVISPDEKEHLIPNEDFISNKVVNWTFNDKRNSIILTIGVSYDSDMHKVKDLILESISGIDRILKEPKPQVFMDEFADSSVNFKLKIWFKDPEKGIPNLRNDVLFSIWDKFKENNIEIPYPKRDIYMKK